MAQDTWVILPSVALAALAVRALLSGDRAQPVIAGLLYAAGVVIRQEMLIVLFPLFLAAARMDLPIRWRRAVAACLAAGLPLLALAAYRQASTGRFALSSEHAGLAMLGAYIPGAAANAWTDTYPFVASVRPDLLRDRQALVSQAPFLALREVLRRPGFQAARILSSICTFAVAGEEKSLYWTLSAPGALPEPVRERGDALTARLEHPLHGELAGIQGFFLAAVLIGIRRRNLAILALVLAVLLKYAIHAFTVSQGRYFFVATALEILAIAVAAYEIRAAGSRLLLSGALAASMAFSLGLLQFSPTLAAFVRNRDVDSQRTYHFVLEPHMAVRDPSAELACGVDRGLLVALGWPPWSATLRTFQLDPAPGEAATAVCQLTGTGEPRPLLLQVLDDYPRGGLPGRMLQRVELDGVEVLSHDIAEEPGSGWASIPLGNVGAGTHRKIVIEVKAIHPDPGAAWGNAARTTFQLSRP